MQTLQHIAESGVGLDLAEKVLPVNKDVKENLADSDAIPDPRF